VVDSPTGRALADALALRARASLAELAASAADRTRIAHDRAIALLAVAVALACDPTALAPPEALDALDDPELVDAALASGLAAALTGVLRAAPADASWRPVRVLVGRRLVAAGETGPHVVELLLAAGDRTRAASLAADDLAHQLGGADELARWIRLRWLAAQADDVVAEVLALLGDNQLERLGKALDRLPGETEHVRSLVGARIHDRSSR
jgi:hypothetical protein